MIYADASENSTMRPARNGWSIDGIGARLGVKEKTPARGAGVRVLRCIRRSISAAFRVQLVSVEGTGSGSAEKAEARTAAAADQSADQGTRPGSDTDIN